MRRGDVVGERESAFRGERSCALPSQGPQIERVYCEFDKALSMRRGGICGDCFHVYHSIEDCGLPDRCRPC